MGNTSVYMPRSLLKELDTSAAGRGMSRNRLIVEACRQVVRARRQWSAGFFSNSRFTSEELAELQGAAAGFSAAIAKRRRNRRGKPL